MIGIHEYHAFGSEYLLPFFSLCPFCGLPCLLRRTKTGVGYQLVDFRVVGGDRWMLETHLAVCGDAAPYLARHAAARRQFDAAREIA